MKLRLALCCAATLSAVVMATIACDEGDSPPDTPVAATPFAAATSPSASPAAGAVTTAPAGPVTFNVIGGKADGNIDIEMFMPADIHIREGDRIEWALQGFEGHTVTFATPQQFTDLTKNYLQPDPADAGQLIFNPDIALRAGGDTMVGDGAYINSGF